MGMSRRLVGFIVCVNVEDGDTETAEADRFISSLVIASVHVNNIVYKYKK